MNRQYNMYNHCTYIYVYKVSQKEQFFFFFLAEKHFIFQTNTNKGYVEFQYNIRIKNKK